MLVFELPLKICFLTPLSSERVSERIGQFISGALHASEEYSLYRENDRFQSYTFDQPFPLESGHIYLEGKIYTVRIRTISQKLAEFFVSRLSWYADGCLQILDGELRVIPRYFLERVHTLTPVVVKTEQGYWRNQMKVEEFVERLKTNLIRKYNFFQNTQLEGDFCLFRKMEFINRKPVRIPQKNISLLGDKVSLTAAQNETAQELLYMALGTGVGENNAAGCGFLGYRFR
ncbi:MAG TPA: CRISPR-associated endoribonuclease Cas6 [Candidatus Eisenbergiella merdipullorum]|uniref:CRISPR-associated endoribonuclease Cas6 n=1 Tax=Candidatus Eisenbergiella merdipullorum TaxID=2838553 RepID=A0A9D2I955_9FIRM|nr:CRISPR-associated endoribonuclease Cas6 [Candidatus Eisenbergiella merdipullorum]